MKGREPLVVPLTRISAEPAAEFARTTGFPSQLDSQFRGGRAGLRSDVSFVFFDPKKLESLGELLGHTPTATDSHRTPRG